MIEIRPDLEVKNYLRDIINDVQSKFDVHTRPADMWYRSLRCMQIIKERDLPTGGFLVSNGATSRPSWRRTMDAVNRKQTPSDHEGLRKPIEVNYANGKAGDTGGLAGADL